MKWRYGSIWPTARFIDPSIDMSMPLSAEATRGTRLNRKSNDIGVKDALAAVSRVEEKVLLGNNTETSKDGLIVPYVIRPNFHKHNSKCE